MPRTRGIVPVDVPPIRPEPVKRSASLVSLPTPPRTHHKRKRARSRVTDSDSEDDVPVVDRSVGEADEEDEREHANDSKTGRRDANGALVLGHKKRKTLDAIAEELSEVNAEEAFWMGEEKAVAGRASADRAGSTKVRSHYRLRERGHTRSPSSSPPPAPHLLRRGHTGLASPPPSRRQPRTRVRARLATPPPLPQPASAKSRKPGLFPTRDSPDNPFLADDLPASVPESQSPDLPEPEPRTPERFVEKPTITWVFRGTKVQLANPHYHSPESPSDEVEGDAPSLLPEDHPDYSPPPTYAPKLLFPEARRHDLARRTASREPQTRTADPSGSPRPRPRSHSSTSAESSRTEEALSDGKSVPVKPRPEDVEAAMEAAMARRLARRLGRNRTDDGDTGEEPRTRTRAYGAPRLPEKDSDPARRAMGPVRVAEPLPKERSS